MKATHKFTTFVLGISFLFSPLLFAANPPQLKKQMMIDLETIKGFFAVKYAPLEYKKINLDTEFGKAKKQIEKLSAPTVKDFQIVLKDLLKKFHDYHVNVSYYATEQALLPFTVKGCGGRYFLSFIERSYLPFEIFPFEVGDEILTFGGRPIGQVIKDLKNQECMTNMPRTDQSLAELLLTARRASVGHRVPKNEPLKLSIRSQKDGIEGTVLVDWNYYPEKIKDVGRINKQFGMKANLGIEQGDDITSLIKKSHFFDKMMINAFFDKHYLKSIKGSANPHLVGAVQSFVPRLGNVLWQAPRDLSFDAYIFEMQGDKKVGYLRIPHYLGDMGEMMEFQELINLFEIHTDALVIDQLNNPGGSVFYLYALASALTDKPLDAPKHRIILTQQEIFLATQLLPILDILRSDFDAKMVLGDSLGGYPITLEVAHTLRRFLQFILNEWENGQFLTSPTFVYGVDQIMPSKKGYYTKPILTLMNELDFSAADFFPAIMRDNKRGTLLGTRTAGAGGYVYDVDFPNNMGIASLAITGSLAMLPSDPAVEIENRGVKPDITYAITAADIQGNYTGFVQTILDTLQSIVHKVNVQQEEQD